MFASLCSLVDILTQIYKKKINFYCFFLIFYHYHQNSAEMLGKREKNWIFVRISSSGCVGSKMRGISVMWVLRWEMWQYYLLVTCPHSTSSDPVSPISHYKVSPLNVGRLTIIIPEQLQQTFWWTRTSFSRAISIISTGHSTCLINNSSPSKLHSLLP